MFFIILTKNELFFFEKQKKMFLEMFIFEFRLKNFSHHVLLIWIWLTVILITADQLRKYKISLYFLRARERLLTIHSFRCSLSSRAILRWDTFYVVSFEFKSGSSYYLAYLTALHLTRNWKTDINALLNLKENNVPL